MFWEDCVQLRSGGATSSKSKLASLNSFVSIICHSLGLGAAAFSSQSAGQLQWLVAVTLSSEKWGKAPPTHVFGLAWLVSSFCAPHETVGRSAASKSGKAVGIQLRLRAAVAFQPLSPTLLLRCYATTSYATSTDQKDVDVPAKAVCVDGTDFSSIFNLFGISQQAGFEA